MIENKIKIHPLLVFFHIVCFGILGILWPLIVTLFLTLLNIIKAILNVGKRRSVATYDARRYINKYSWLQRFAFTPHLINFQIQPPGWFFFHFMADYTWNTSFLETIHHSLADLLAYFHLVDVVGKNFIVQHKDPLDCNKLQQNLEEPSKR